MKKENDIKTQLDVAAIKFQCIHELYVRNNNSPVWNFSPKYQDKINGFKNDSLNRNNY
jgi:hypothetical protein